MEIREEMGHFT